MSLRQLPKRKSPVTPQPTWEIAHLYPYQGGWSEEDYFEFCDSREPHPILELAAGRLEILPMPTEPHQFIMQFFFKWLEAFVLDHSLGTVVISGILDHRSGGNDHSRIDPQRQILSHPW